MTGGDPHLDRHARDEVPLAERLLGYALHPHDTPVCAVHAAPLAPPKVCADFCYAQGGYTYFGLQYAQE